jgi:hypothetical protein
VEVAFWVLNMQEWVLGMQSLKETLARKVNHFDDSYAIDMVTRQPTSQREKSR